MTEKKIIKGEENLIPTSKRTKEEQRKIAVMGGKASGVARKKRKALKELLEIALSMEVAGDQTAAEAVTAALIQKAMDGDTKAFEVIRDTVGEKPTEKSQVQGEINIGWG